MMTKGFLRRTAVMTVGFMIWFTIVPTLTLGGQEEDVFQRARRFIDGGDLEAAIKLLEDYILKIKAVAAQKKNVAEAYYTLAKSYYMAGEDRKSEANLRLVFEAYPEYIVSETNKIFLARVVKIRAEVAQAATVKKALEEKQAAEDRKRQEEEAEARKEEEKRRQPRVIAGTQSEGAAGKIKKKFPWLAVVGGAVAVGILAAVLLSGKGEVKTGDISVISTPFGAKVFLDGQDTGQKTACILSKIPVGTHGLRLEIANYGKWEGNVQVIDGQTANVSVTLAGFVYEYVMQWGGGGQANGVFDGPTGIAVDSSGNVYVSDRKNHRVQKFTSAGTYLAKFGTGTPGAGDGQLYYPHGVAVDTSGNVYVANNLGGRIQKFNSNGAFVLKWGSEGSGDGQFVHPDGIAVDSSNYVYVAADDRIQKFNSNGLFVTKWGGHGSGNGYFDWTYGVAVSSTGYVYVVDVNGNRIQRFNSSGTFLAQWGGVRGNGDLQFDHPLGIAIDSEGYCYVVDAYNHRVQKLTSTGTFVAKWGNEGDGNGQFRDPVGIAIDPSGYIYVSDESKNRIQKFRITTSTMAAATVTYSPLRSGSGLIQAPPSSPLLKGIIPGKPAGPAGAHPANPKKEPTPETIKETIR